MLNFILSKLGFQVKIDEGDQTEMIEYIARKYPFWTFHDLENFLLKLLHGEYGTLYNTLGIDKISIFAQQYEEERSQLYCESLNSYLDALEGEEFRKAFNKLSAKPRKK